ncbi:MAG: GNAT family N-acetyltransferase [Candidatus Riflebacteria bacterium]|jgi:RimJ/RimL family protein N-acetyltransferase|nr:GNAT family N-acetyltransferase [Candidatus Riflebacteria bacterium]
MGNDLKLRRWRADDCVLLHAWRNHAGIRRWAGNSDEIEFAAHAGWFERFLADEARFGYILEASAAPVAQIRFDPAELPGCYRISFSAAPGQTGMGYGSQILRLACATAEMQQAASLFIAETMSENIPSQKVFQRNGFIDAGPIMRRQCNMRCWLMSSGRRQVSDHIKLQIKGTGGGYDELSCLLSVTGLADVSDNARIYIFCDAVSSNEKLEGLPVFHLNNSEAKPVLDYVMGAPFALSLPVEFDGFNVAVAQIAAALKHSEISKLLPDH